VRPVAAVRVGVQLELGDVGAGLRWASERGLGADDELTYLREFEHLTLARVLVARGSAEDVARAVGLLRRLLAAADQGGRDGSAIEVLVALAAAHDAAGNRSDAAAALADALDRAEPEGYVRTFLDAGPVVGRLLRSLEGVAGQRAERLLASERSAAARPTARFAGPDELSDRELDVLRLLRSDLSGPEIARALHVSLNTLRTHTKHIYTKLGATNRREVLTRAAELGL
jgi:LuxR family maltose regulon positive regulatory protein